LVGELRAFLQTRLPAYMVPAAFVLLETMPISANGKIDRRALPEPGDLRPELDVAYEAPRNAIEQALAAVWQTVLRVDKVGIHDNFFDLGGQSLLMIQVQSKLREALKRDVSLVELFKYPSISTLAGYLAQEQSATPVSEPEDMADKLKAGKNRLQQQLQHQRRVAQELRSTHD
jgi:acyl carrier protein